MGATQHDSYSSFIPARDTTRAVLLTRDIHDGISLGTTSPYSEPPWSIPFSRVAMAETAAIQLHVFLDRKVILRCHH